MNISRIRRRKRSSKRYLAVFLVIALLFTSVMSFGFAQWQDTLTINADVEVKKAKLGVELKRYNMYSGNNFYKDLSNTSGNKNWMCYVYATTAVGNKGYLVYKMCPSFSGNTMTIYRTIFPSDMDMDYKDGNTTQFTDAHGIYEEYDEMNQFDSETSDSPIRGADSLKHSAYSDEYGFLAYCEYNFYGAEIPVEVKLTNPNSTTVKLTNITATNVDSIKTTNGNTISSSTEFSVPTGGASFVVYPKKSGNEYTRDNIVITFTDDSGNNYQYNIKFSDYSPTNSDFKKLSSRIDMDDYTPPAPPMLMSKPPVNTANAPKTTTTTTTTTTTDSTSASTEPSSENTTASTAPETEQTTGATTSESTAPEAPETTTTTTEAPETTAATTTTTTTTAAPTTTTEAPTTTTTTTTTAKSTTTTTEKPTTTTTTAPEQSEE